jgi:hypothetical protein
MSTRFAKLTDLTASSGTATGWINVKDSTYGAVGDGVTDDTAAIQAAANAIASTGGVLYFPPGSYVITNSITISKPTMLIGCGGNMLQNYPVSPAPNGVSNIICNSATLDAFIVNIDGCSFSGLVIFNNQTTPTAGHGILFNKAQCAKIIDCAVFGFYRNIEIVNGYLWKIEGCFLFGAVSYNLVIANEDIPDAGDSSISNSWFYTGTHVNMTHVRYTSGGGLKVNSCKFNSGGQLALHCIDASINHSTIILQVVNCSFENFSGDGIRTIPTVGGFGNVIILGNEFSQSGSPVGNCITIGGIAVIGQGSIFNAAIDNNIFTTTGPGINVGGAYGTYHGYNIMLGDSDYVTIGAGNVYHSSDGSSNIAPYVKYSSYVNIARQTETTIIAPGANVNYDINSGVNKLITLNTDTTINVTNALWEYFMLAVRQGGAGGWKINFPNSVCIGQKSINPLPNSVTYIRGYYDIRIGLVYTVDNYSDLGRLSTSEKNAFANIFPGATCYDITLNKLCVYTGSAWETITSV